MLLVRRLYQEVWQRCIEKTLLTGEVNQHVSFAVLGHLSLTSLRMGFQGQQLFPAAHFPLIYHGLLSCSCLASALFGFYKGKNCWEGNSWALGHYTCKRSHETYAHFSRGRKKTIQVVINIRYIQKFYLIFNNILTFTKCMPFLFSETCYTHLLASKKYVCGCSTVFPAPVSWKLIRGYYVSPDAPV